MDIGLGFSRFFVYHVNRSGILLVFCRKTIGAELHHSSSKLTC